MDDDQILERGGEESDIIEYAKQNGATYEKELYNREQTEQCVEANVYIAESGNTTKATRQIMAHIDTLIESKLKERDAQVVEDLKRMAELARELVFVIDKDGDTDELVKSMASIFNKYQSE